MTDARASSGQAIRGLCAWATSTGVTAIPRAVLARAVRVLADDLSAIIGARSEPEVTRFHDRLLNQPRASEATVFRGGRPRTDRISAAVANAVAANWLELDEGYRPISCHAGLYVVPALLAEAETRNLAFDEMLRALVLSYEITTRIARAWKLRAMNIQPHGRFSSLGAAAGIALSRSCGEQLLADCLGTAVTLTGSSPRTHLAEGTLSRNVWPAAGAWAGSMAVEWAECGIAGAPTAFHDVYTELLGGTAHLEALTDGLGDRWAILDGYTKIHACCQHLHSAVEATVGLRNGLLAEASLDDITAVRVETHGLALPLTDAWPRTTLGAKFSIPHAIAAALVTGSGGADAFAANTLTDPAIARLRERVRVEPYTPELPPPNDRPARVTLQLRDGRKFQRECLSAAGGPDRPLPSETVFDKLSVLAGPVYPAMRSVFETLTKLPSNRMNDGWAQIVKELCES